MKKHHWYTILHVGIVLHFLAYIFLAIIATFGNVATKQPAPALAATFDIKAFVSKSEPDSVHEGNPHGVPSYYSWYNNARLYELNQPRVETTHVNFWGEIYADTTNAHPANTRVALKNCQFWGLISGTWTQLQNTTLGGGAWTEDYTSYVTTMDIRTESDGSQSIYPRPNQNAHFWADTGFWDATGVTFQATIATCHTRLVLADPNGIDDRGSARYLVSMGADWRQPDGSCPFVFGSYICDGMAHGRYIRVGNEWRTAVMSTMSASQVASFPAPPSSIFLQPDGSYSDMLPEITSFTASPTVVQAGGASTLNWSVKGAGTVNINQGIGAVTGVSKSVNPTASTTYTLTATNLTGSSTASTTITVPGSTPSPGTSTGSGSSGGAGGAPTNSGAVVPVDTNGDGVIDDAEIKSAEQKAADQADQGSLDGIELPEIKSGIAVQDTKTKMTAVEMAGIVAGSGMVLLSSGLFIWWLRIRRQFE